MARPPPDPELIDLVLNALASGRSHADVARAAGVGESTIDGWAKKHTKRLARMMRPRKPKATKRPDPPKGKAEDAAVDAASIEVSRKMRRDMLSRADAAAEVGNYSASQRFMRDAAAMQTVIARQEKASQTDADTVRVPRSEIEGAIDSARARVRALLARPLLCAHCSRALSIKWAEESQPEPAPAPAVTKQRRSK